MRKRRSVADFFTGFKKGYDTTNEILTDVELGKIARAEPEKITNDITYEGMTGGMDQQDIPRKETTSFLGKEYDGPLDDTQKDKARLMAMSGVYSKFGNPEQGIKLRQQATQSEILERQNKRGQEEDNTMNLRKEADQKTADYLRGLQQTDESGTAKPLTDSDFMNASKFRVFALTDAGLFDDAGKVAEQGLTYANRLIEAQTKERTQAFGQAASAALQGNFEGMKNAYNKYIPDGAAIDSITPNADGTVTIARRSTVDGADLGKQTIPLQQLIASAETLVDPKAASAYLQRTFQNDIEKKRLQLSQNADSRAGAAEGRAQEAFDTTKADRSNTKAQEEAKREASVAIFKEQNPGATNAQLEAVRQGIVPPTTDTSKITSDFKPNSYGEGGTATQKLPNGEMVITKIDSKGNVAGQRVVPAPGRQPQTPAPKKLEKVTDADVAATAKKYGISEKEVRERLKSQGLM